MRTYEHLARLFRGRRRDVIGVAAAVALMLPTLAYRYGIDQAFYHYVGAGWLHAARVGRLSAARVAGTLRGV